jgi:hypothetical protein
VKVAILVSVNDVSHRPRIGGATVHDPHVRVKIGDGIAEVQFQRRDSCSPWHCERVNDFTAWITTEPIHYRARVAVQNTTASRGINRDNGNTKAASCTVVSAVTFTGSIRYAMGISGTAVRARWLDNGVTHRITVRQHLQPRIRRR